MVDGAKEQIKKIVIRKIIRYIQIKHNMMKTNIHFDEMQKLWKPGQHPAAKLL